MVRPRKELVERLPEAERPVPDRDPGWDGQAPPLDLDQKLAPALGTLAHTGLEAHQFLLALRGGPDQHQHALGLVLHPGLQVDPVGPHIDIPASREIARLPAIVFALPFSGQSGDGGRRQVWGILAQKGRECLLEVAGREPTQVQDRQQRIQAPRPPRPFRQDRRGKADAVLAGGAAVADLDPADLHRADAALDHALRSMAMPDQALASIRQLEMPHAGEKGFSLDLDGLGQQLTGTGSENIGQGIVNRVGLTQADKCW